VTPMSEVVLKFETTADAEVIKAATPVEESE
jgi:hypothetical protein